MADLLSEQGTHGEELDRIRRRVAQLEERVRQQEHDAVALRDASDKYRDLVEHTLDWIWEVDAEGRYTYVGPQAKRILGYDPSELLGKTPFDLMTETESAVVAKKFSAAVKARTPLVQVINRNRHRDGHIVTLETSGTPIIGENDELIGYRGVDRDVTVEKTNEEQRKRLEEQVRHTQQLESLGILAGGIAHDFNNLLMAILGNADLAMVELSQEELRPYLQDIVGASKRAAELCSQMLSYSGRGTFSMQGMDLNDVVDRAAATISLSLAAGVTTRIEKGRNIPTVNVDSAQVRQVLMNILTNASEAMNDAEGEVVISTGVMSCTEADLEDFALGQRLSPGPYAYLEVHDKGCGMDDETRARVFDPFYTTKFTGRGLGLAAALGIMHAHHGGIRITSRPGRGTSVRLLFPLATLPGDYTQQDEATTPENEGTRKTILLVDDEEAIRVVGRKMLERLGYQVLTADCGLAAVEALKSRNARINCVILDLTMPDMDGEETLKELRRVDSTVPVLLTSGFGEEAVGKRFAGTDLAGFVHKPYDSDALMAKLAVALS